MVLTCQARPMRLDHHSSQDSGQVPGVGWLANDHVINDARAVLLGR